MVPAKNKNYIYYLHVVIFFLLTFCIGLLPPFAQITEMGMKVLGIFIGVVYGWLFLGLAWPSIVALVALGLSGYTSGGVNGMFVSGFSYMILPQLILCYLFADAIAQTGITDYFAKKLLSFDVLAKKPILLMFVFLFALFIMILLRAGMAILFLMWKMFRDMASKAGYPERNDFCTLMVSSTLVVYLFSSLAFPFNAGTLMQISYFNKGLPDIEVSMFGWLILWCIFVAVYIVLWTLVVKVVLRPDFSKIASIGYMMNGEHNGEKVKLTREQKLGFAMLALFIFLVFSPTFIPATTYAGQILNNLGLTGSLAIVLIIMCIYRKANGEEFFSLQKAGHSVIWDVVWLLVATEPLANAFNSADCGIITSIMTFFMPILNNMSPMVFLIGATVLLGLVTQVVHNLILIVVFIPLLCPMYLEMGGNPLVMFFTLFVAFNAAFGTPAASWSSALMFGEKSGITKKMYVFGFVHFFFAIILALLISPLAGVLLQF